MSSTWQQAQVYGRLNLVRIQNIGLWWPRSLVYSTRTPRLPCSRNRYNAYPTSLVSKDSAPRDVTLTVISAPENVFFEICDAEDEWGFTTPFDLIHMRAITSCFQNPKAVFASALKSLAPGGYIHLRDPILPFRYLTPPPDDCALKKWNDLLIEAAEKAGRRWTDAHNYRDWLVELGYRDVVEIIERVPLSPWAKGQRMKVISLWLQQDMLAGVEGMTMALLTRVLGWKVEDVRVFLEQVMKDMQDTSLHAYAEG